METATATQGVGDIDSTIQLRVIDNVATPYDVTNIKEWFPSRKRSIGDQDDKLVKKLKTVHKNNHAINKNQTFNENELDRTKMSKTAKAKNLRNQGRDNDEFKSLTRIRTRNDIEESIKEAASMSHGQIPNNSKHTNEKLMSFWHCSINECLACETSTNKYFTKAKWNHHIKTVHGLNRPMYVQKYGNPDLTQFKHSCYLCGKEVLQLYTVIKRHLETLHDGMSIEFYTREFRDLIVQERATQPVLFNQRSLLEGWSDGCIYSCNLCSTSFYSTSTLENHLSVVHKNAVDLSKYTMLTPTLTRYHKCYICGKKLRQEHKIINSHLHKWHQLEFKRYTDQFQDYVRMELKAKGMNYILEEEVELAKRPSLATYLNKINLEAHMNQLNGDKILKDWANFCDYKCFCEEIFGSYLKLHLHIARKHEYKNMAQYRKEHGEPSVLHRLHKCRLCRNNMKWEASRIRDHLKKQHKDKNFTLQTYAHTFRQEILSDIQKLNIQTEKDEAQEPFRFGKMRLGGDKVEYSQEEWKHLTSKKVDPNSWVSCPTCAWEMKQASLYRHINNAHPNVIQELMEDLRAGKNIDCKWKNIEVDINASDDAQEEKITADDAQEEKNNADDAQEEKINADAAMIKDSSALINTEEVSNKKEEYEKTDLSFVRIDPETGEIMLTDSLPFAKEELECVLTETKNSSKILYFCNSETAATYDNSELTADNTEDVENSSDEEDGSLTGRIVVVEPSDETDEELGDQTESIAETIQVASGSLQQLIKFDNTTNNIPSTEQAAFKDHEDFDHDEDLSESVGTKDCVEYELEQTIHLSADCRAYVATKPKISNQKSIDEDLNVCNENNEAYEVMENVEVDGGKDYKEKVFTDGDKTDMNVQTDDFYNMDLDLHAENTVTKVDLSSRRISDDFKAGNVVNNSLTATDNILTKNVRFNDIDNSINIKNINDRSFQSIIMGSDGGSIQRIAVIHRKGDGSSRLDRSLLLNHISSLINNMDTTESSNLKIIEIEVEADESVDKTAALLANSVVRKATKRKSVVKSGGGCSGNSYGFSIKTISQPTDLQNNCVSRGTQVSKWTKMGGELQKIANDKIVEGRRQTSVSMSTSGLVEKDIAGKLEFIGPNGVAQCSIGVQVIWENRARGTIDLDEEKIARDKITIWINTSSSQIQNCKKCPGCFKEFTRKRNLLQHLQCKHGVQLTGELGHAFQMHMETENATVACPDCSILLSKKSLRRHQRQIHKQ